MKKVILTGANGFVGRHALPCLLERGYEVHAVSSSPTQTGDDKRLIWHCCDLLASGNIEQLCHEVQADALLHLAWVTDPASYWNSTDNFHWLRTSIQLFESFVQHGGSRIVCSGSCAEYDWSVGDCVENESPCQATSPYASCKLALSSILQSFTRAHAISSAWGRLFFLFGAHEQPQRLVPYIINQLLKGEPVVCRNGELMRDYMYVNDVADALVSLLDSDTQGVVNIASGQAIKIRDIATSLAIKLDRQDLVQSATAQQEEAALLVASTLRLHNEVHWSPRYSLDEGLELSLDWWKNNRP